MFIFACVWLDVYVYYIYVYMRKGYAFQQKYWENWLSTCKKGKYILTFLLENNQNS